MINNKCKVLVSVPPLNEPGGVSNYYRIVKRYLAMKCIDGVEFFEHGSHQSRTRFVPGIFKEITGYINSISHSNCSVIHLNPSLQFRSVCRNAVFLIIGKFFHKKTIVFWRGWDKRLAKVIELYVSKIFAAIFNLADLSLVLASQIRQDLQKFGIKHKVIVTTTIVDTALANIGLSTFSDGPSLIFMARLVSSKGIRQTIEAFRLLRNEFPNLRLHVVGDGPERATLMKLYSGVAGLYFHGYLNDDKKYALMKNCDVFVFPTNHGEGMPNCILEAMSAGLPIVTRAIGGISDFFRRGKHGFLVQTNSPEELALRVTDLLNDGNLLKQISIYNRQYAEKYFSAEIVTEFLRHTYSKVCDNQIEGLYSEWFNR